MVDKVSDEGAGGWREKYLDLLDEHEVLEHQAAEQRYLLQRALVRVSLAAEGQDRELDRALALLRERLRSGEVADLQPLLEPMDKALLAFDKQREIIWQALRDEFLDSVKPLQGLSLPRPITAAIQQFITQVPDDIRKIHAYPALVHMLGSLYGQVVEQLRTPDTGLLGKIFGRSSAVEVASETRLPSAAAEAATEPQPESSTEELAPTPPVVETHIVTNVRDILDKLLISLHLPDSLVARRNLIQQALADMVEERQLPELIESVADLVTDGWLQSGQAFASYLNAVNQELADISLVIGGAAEHEESREARAKAWQASMFQEMTDLAEQTRDAGDLNQLKSMVSNRLGDIRQALRHYQQEEEENRKMSGQLQELARRVRAMEAEAEKNRTMLEMQRQKALQDALTGLPNRAAYSERINSEYQRWLRYRHPLTLAICDIDHFKQINDTFGHQAGDRVLRFISRSIARRLREVDFFGRYGGEEFVFIMPDTTREQAFGALEKIRAAIAATQFNYQSRPMPITLSMGITQFVDGDRIETALARADNALYIAKSNGRNCCQLI